MYAIKNTKVLIFVLWFFVSCIPKPDSSLLTLALLNTFQILRPPSLVSITPEDGAENQSPNLKVETRFSKSMNMNFPREYTNSACDDAPLELSSDDFQTCVSGTFETIGRDGINFQPRLALPIGLYKVRFNPNLARDTNDNSFAFTSTRGFRVGLGNAQASPLTVTLTVNNTNIDQAIVHPRDQTVVRFAFNKPVNLSTLTGNGGNGSCTGSVQVSFNDFQTCVNDVPTAMSTSDNQNFAITLSGFNSELEYYRFYKMKLSTSVAATDGATLAQEVLTATGFQTTAPCGTLTSPTNCFWTPQPSLNLSFGLNPVIISPTDALPNQQHVVVPVGTGAGGLVFKYSYLKNAFEPGADHGTAFNTGLSGFYLDNPAAPASRFNKVLFFTGGAGGAEYRIYDPDTDNLSSTFIAPSSVASGAFSFKINSGVNSGRQMILLGGSSTNRMLYDPVAGSFPSHTGTAPCPIVAGAFALEVPSGFVNAGQTIVFCRNTNNISIYNPSTDNFTAGPTLPSTLGNGAFAIPITRGSNSGRILVVFAGNSTTTALLDPNGFSSSLFTNLPFTSNGSGTAFMVPSNIPTTGRRIVILRGSVSGDTAIFDGDISFVAGPNVPFNFSNNRTFPILRGAYRDFQMVLGNSNIETAIYNPNTNQFLSGNILSTAQLPAPGATLNLVRSGPNAGRVLATFGGGAPGSVWINLTSPSINIGPSFTNNIAFGGFSFPLLDASNNHTPTGDIFFSRGANTAGSYRYVAASGTITTDPVSLVSVGAGSKSFYIRNGTLAGDQVFIAANGVTAVRRITHSNLAVTTNPNLPSNPNGANIVIGKNSSN